MFNVGWKLYYTVQSLVLDFQYAPESSSNSLHLVSFFCSNQHVLFDACIFWWGSCLSLLVNNQIRPFAYVTLAVCLAKGTVVDAKKKNMEIICSSVLYDSSPFLVNYFSGKF